MPTTVEEAAGQGSQDSNPGAHVSVTITPNPPSENQNVLIAAARSAPAPEVSPLVTVDSGPSPSPFSLAPSPVQSPVNDDRVSPRLSPKSAPWMTPLPPRLSENGDDRKLRVGPSSMRESRDGTSAIVGLDTIPEASLTEFQWRQQHQQSTLEPHGSGVLAQIKKGLSRVSTKLRISFDGKAGDLSRNASSNLGPGTRVDRLEKLAHKRGGVAAHFAYKIREMDKDGNGYIDADDLVDCMVNLAQEQQQRRMWFAFAVVSMITTLFTIVVIVGLSILITEMFKDTKVSSNVMVVKGTDTAVQVASADFRLADDALMSRGAGGSMVNVATRLTTVRACPFDLSEETLRHVDVLQFTLDAGRNLTAYLKPFSFVTASDALTFYTDLGNITFAAGCSSVYGSAITQLSTSFGLSSEAAAEGGRRLLQLANYYVSTKSGSTSGSGYFG